MTNRLCRSLFATLLLSIALSGCTKQEIGFNANRNTTPEASTKLVTYLTGDASDVYAGTNPGLLLMGGGTDVDNAVKWFLERSGGGDVVVIRATGADGYNQYMYDMVPVNSVETIIIDNRAKASLASVSDKIRKAEALFIAGGDQWDYVSYWKDTPVEDAINYLLNTKKVPVGGTSAGLAILGDSYFTAQNGSAVSSDALANPYNRYVTIDHSNFLFAPFMASTITDSHYTQRDRQGRHIVFMARMMKDWAMTSVKGIGIDEQTAVCVDGNGTGKVYGINNAYFLQNNGPGPETCKIKTALTWNRSATAVKAYRIQGSTGGNGNVNLASWTGFSGGSSYFYYVNSGSLLMQ